jgi:hypothetical protein
MRSILFTNDRRVFFETIDGKIREANATERVDALRHLRSAGESAAEGSDA